MLCLASVRSFLTLSFSMISRGTLFRERMELELVFVEFLCFLHFIAYSFMVMKLYGQY